jgi:hypothetical protein
MRRLGSRFGIFYTNWLAWARSVRRIDTMCDSVYYHAMSPKDRFQLMIEPAQLAALRRIQDETGAPISEQIRRAIAAYLEKATPKKKK